MNFCTQCGAPVRLEVPAGDDRDRHVCQACGEIHYVNPKVIVGCIPEWEGEVLLCRRAIEPRYGLWTLPAGFLENGESVAEGALREAREEANANLEIGELFGIFSIPHISQVYAIYRARLTDTRFSPGQESLEVQLFPESGIPWQALAFPVMRKSLELYFEDRRLGRPRVHHGDIVRVPGPGYRVAFDVRSV